MLVYTATTFKSKGKKKVVKGVIARKLTSSQSSSFSTPRPTLDYSFRRSSLAPIYKSLDTTVSNTTRNSVMDPVQLAKESPEVQEAIIAKSKRIAIAYSKGAYQYVTDETDAKTIGKKNAG